MIENLLRDWRICYLDYKEPVGSFFIQKTKVGGDMKKRLTIKQKKSADYYIKIGNAALAAEMQDTEKVRLGLLEVKT